MDSKINYKRNVIRARTSASGIESEVKFPAMHLAWLNLTVALKGY